MIKITLPKISLVIGGAASGKSKYAESIVMSSGLPRSYIATAQVYDTEIEAKVTKHKAQRGSGWQTFETPYAPWDALAKIAPPSAVLLDCVTLWLSNIMLDEQNLDIAKQNLFARLQDFDGHIVIVTNEVGQGVVPDNALARNFRQKQGELNQELAAIADLVVLVTAGLPLALKGHLPQ